MDAARAGMNAAGALNVLGTVGKFESLQSTYKAKKLLSYVPRHSWRTSS